MQKFKEIFFKIPKKIRVGALLLVLTLLIFRIIIQFTTQTTITKNLSDRAKEYLSQQKSKNPGYWDKVNFEEPPKGATSSGVVSVGGCFQIEIPFGIKEIRKEGKCANFFILTNGKGQVHAYVAPMEASSLGEISHVIMRRSKPDVYQESSEVINGRTFLEFKHNDTYTYEKVAFYPLDGQKMLVVSLASNSNIKMDQMFLKILESIQI